MGQHERKNPVYVFHVPDLLATDVMNTYADC